MTIRLSQDHEAELTLREMNSEATVNGHRKIASLNCVEMRGSEAAIS